MDKEEIIETAEEIISKLYRLKDEVGTLDDLFDKTPYIDNRMERGAFQLIRDAIKKIEAYQYEVSVE